MSSYFLVARNKNNNSFQVININEKWYLGDSGLDTFHCANSLEAIDLVTSCFENREHLIERLFINGYIDDKNMDIFIASKTKIDDKDYINFDEVIYGSRHNKRMSGFKKMAKVSLESDVHNAKEQLLELYDEIGQSAYICVDLYRMIIDGDSNIPRKFAELLRDVPLYEGDPENIKYDFDFHADDYYTVRSIVEMLNRLEILSCSSKSDRAMENEKFIAENIDNRRLLIFDLIVKLGGNICEEQEKNMSTEEETNDTQKSFEIIKLPKSSLNIEEKKKEVFAILKSFPKNLFLSTAAGYEVNYSLFSYPLFDEEKQKLDNLLTGNMPRFFMNYLFYRNRLEEVRKGFPSPSEVSDIQDEIERSRNSINKRFKSEKCVNQTYDWCRLYEACRQRDMSYSSMGEEVNTGDNNAKVYSKKPE